MIRSLTTRLCPYVIRSETRNFLAFGCKAISLPTHIPVRWKHITSGIQGNRNSKQKAAAKKFISEDEEENEAIKEMNEEHSDVNIHDS